MTKSIRKQIENDPLFQRALALTPEENRKQVEEYSNNVLSMLEEMTEKVQQLVENPELRKELQKALQKRGMTNGL